MAREPRARNWRTFTSTAGDAFTLHPLSLLAVELPQQHIDLPSHLSSHVLLQSSIAQVTLPHGCPRLVRCFKRALGACILMRTHILPYPCSTSRPNGLGLAGATQACPATGPTGLLLPLVPLQLQRPSVVSLGPSTQRHVRGQHPVAQALRCRAQTFDGVNVLLVIIPAWRAG